MTFQGSRAGNMLYNYRRLSYEDKRRKTAFHSRVPLSDGRFAESGVKAQGFKDVAEAAIETDLKYEGIATLLVLLHTQKLLCRIETDLKYEGIATGQ